MEESSAHTLPARFISRLNDYVSLESQIVKGTAVSYGWMYNIKLHFQKAHYTDLSKEKKNVLFSI